MTLFRRWLGPGLAAILLLVLYQLFLAPSLNDLLADWQFLHASRQQMIQQYQQQQRQAQPAPQKP